MFAYDRQTDRHVRQIDCNQTERRTDKQTDRQRDVISKRCEIILFINVLHVTEPE